MYRLAPVLALILVLACSSVCRAADARVHVIIDIGADGVARVSQRWDGIHALDRLEYDTGTDELGVLTAPVHEGHAELDYESAELLRRDGSERLLIIARMDYLGNWMDFDVTLRYPQGLEYVSADPKPSFTSSEARGLMWSLPEQRELILAVRLTSGGSGPATGTQQEQDSGSNVARRDPPRDDAGAEPGQEEPSQPQEARRESPSKSPQGGVANVDAPQAAEARPRELLIDGDPLLLEFRLLINAARREGKADEDFLEALEKLLLKFYYLLDAMEATDEYEP